MKNYFTVSGIVRLIAAALLVWALDRHAYGYYKLLRWVVCGTGTYSAFLALASNKITWVWVLGIIAVVFNPLIPVHLDRDTWSIIDTVAAGAFVVSTFFVREECNEPPAEREN